MERKVMVMVEVTEQETHLIKAYSDGLADGWIHPDADSSSDTDDLQNVWKAHTPALKGLLYKLTGATLKELSRFRNEAIRQSADHYVAHREAKEAETWAASVLGYSTEKTEESDET